MPTVSDSVVKSKAIELGNAGKSSTELSNWLTANGATADQSFSAGVEYNKALANRTASAASRRTSSGSTTSSNVTGNIADGLNGV
jgi:hypothetical protein